MRRLLLAVAVMAFPIAGTLAISGTASAASGGVICTGFSGKVNLTTNSAKIKLSKCNDTANTGGKGTTSGASGATTGTITWGGTGTTTLGSIVETVVSPSTCPSGDLEESSTGTVTGGTGAAKKSIKKGWTEQETVCYNPSNNKLTLLPGTTFQIAAGL
jgi:hypothetical protein